MYRLKQIPDDFIVEEINPDLKLDKEGTYSTYRLTKKQYNTMDALQAISKKWRIPLKFFNFAGTKDRQAETIQYITISKGPKEDIELKDVSLKYLGQRKERLNLGDLEGNRFTITIRNIERKPEGISYIPNYFDSQRFGNRSNNHIIGKNIIKGEFNKALNMVDDRKKDDYQGNPIGYFQSIPKKTAKMYVHAYQSYIFNKIVSNIVSETKNKSVETEFNLLKFPIETIENKKIPLIGFGTEEDEDIGKILDEEDIVLRDFIIRKIPFLSSEGEERDMLVEVKDLKIGDLEDDELNPGKKKCKVEFILPKGSYATIAVKAMMI